MTKGILMLMALLAMPLTYQAHRVYMPLVQQGCPPCPCTCPTSSSTTSTTTTTTTTSSTLIQPYIEWFGAEPSRLKRSSPDILVRIHGTGFVPGMVAFLPFLGYFSVSISGPATGSFIVPEPAWSSFPDDGPPEQELYAMLFDSLGRSSDIFVFIVEL